MDPLNFIYLCILLLGPNFNGKAHGLFQTGREVVYRYSATVVTWTKLPAPFSSQFNLTALLTVQGLQDEATLQLSRVQYSMYSGDVRLERTVNLIQLPDNAEALLKPFGILYKHGKVTSIMVSSEEPVWSKSVKQALAAVLQLDLHGLSLKEPKTAAFKSTELSLNGECEVLYSVMPGESGVEVTKHISVQDCKGKPVVWFNIENDYCPDFKPPNNHKVVSSSERKYDVTMLGEAEVLIKQVTSEGETFVFDSLKSRNTLTITVHQKLELQSLREVTKYFGVANSTELKGLKYNTTEFNSFKYSTNDDLELVMKKALQLLPVIVYQLQGPDQLLPVAKPQQPQLIPLLITYLRKLDITLLHSIYVELENKNLAVPLELFVRILPLVGSKESSAFIVSLIGNRKVKDHMAITLLHALAFNIRQTSEEMLQDLESLLNLHEDVGHSVKNAALLSFATVIHRTCAEDNCKQKILDKYVAFYSNCIIENTEDYARQQVCIAALGNIGTEEVIVSLKHVIFGEGSENLREPALRAANSLKHGNLETYQLFWPVLYNRQNNFNLRAAALLGLLGVSRDVSGYIQLHKLMESEDSPSLYNLYYKTVKSFAEESSGCDLARKDMARQILKMSRNPSDCSWLTSHKFHLFGEEVTITTVGESNIESVQISFTSFDSGYPINYYSIFMKLHGVTVELIESTLKAIDAPLEVEMLLLQIFKRCKRSLRPLHIEFIVYNQRRAVATRFYNESNISSLSEEIKSLTSIKYYVKFSSLQVASSFSLEKFFITDLGLPGVLSIDNPSLSSIKSSAVNNTTEQRLWTQSTTVFKVRNTIVDIWQGIFKAHISRSNLITRHHFNHNYDFNISIPHTSGFKWHTSTGLFTVSDSSNYDALAQSCPACSNNSLINNKKAADEVLKNNNSGSFQIVGQVFDCEDDGSVNYVNTVHSMYNNNIFYLVGAVVTAGSSVHKVLTKLPIHGSCGISTVLSSSSATTSSMTCNGFKTNLLENHSNEFFEWNLTIFYGNSESVDKECKLDQNVTASFSCTETEEYTHFSNDECHINTAGKREWESARPQIFDLAKPAADPSELKKVIKISASFDKMPSSMRSALDSWCGDLRHASSCPAYNVRDLRQTAVSGTPQECKVNKFIRERESCSLVFPLC